MSEDKKKANIRAIKSFRLKSNPVQIGEVIRKSDFDKKGDWQNLCHMNPAKAEETSDAVGKVAVEEAEPKPKKLTKKQQEAADKAADKAAGSGGGLPGVNS